MSRIVNEENNNDSTEPDAQTLYGKVKNLLLTYPSKPIWSKSYETINSLRLESESSFGVINQYHILSNNGQFAKCRRNLDDESIISNLDYQRSLKSSLQNKRQYDESLLLNLSIDHKNNYNNFCQTKTSINKYILQNLIHKLQHLDIEPFHIRNKEIIYVTKSVGITTSDAHKFNDREYFFNNIDDNNNQNHNHYKLNRRIVQIQVCFDKHVHGLQVKWLVNEKEIYSGSQHFSSRFSGKNIDTLVLSHNEYIISVTGSCSNWIDSLVIKTNFGRIKSFGSTNEGQPFDLEIPENCQVVGFCGSYSSQLYTLAALYTSINKKNYGNAPSQQIMLKHINNRILKIKQISFKLQNLFADINKKSNADLILLKYLKSNQQISNKNKRKSYKTNNIRNLWMMEVLKVLVKSTAKHDPTVVPQILNLMAMILEDNTVNIFNNKIIKKKNNIKDNKRGGKNNNKDKDENKDEIDSNNDEDPYEPIIHFIKSISMDNDNNQLLLTPNDSDDNITISVNDNNNHNQCIRVMIAIAIARGSLFDLLSIIKMLLRRKLNHEKVYDVSKILNKLHVYVKNLSNDNNIDNNQQNQFHPLQSIKKYASNLDFENNLEKKENDDNDDNDDEQESILVSLFNKNEENKKLSTLELCVILLSELELISISNENEKSWKLNKESLTKPLHIDCSFKVLRILNEILYLTSNELKLDMISNEHSLDLMHRILYHTLKLLTVQVSAIDKLRISIDNFGIPIYRINEIKSMLLMIIRSIKNLPKKLVEAACKTLVKGQKLFFNTTNSKLIYLLALLIRQQEIENNTNNNNVKLREFLADFKDDLVDPISSINSIEIEITLPFMLSQFGSIKQSSSQFIDSLLESNQSKNCCKLFFGTLEMLVSNCCIDINNLENGENEKMSQLLLDLQSMLLFRYQSKFENDTRIIHEFNNKIPISLQSVWDKIYQNPFKIESEQQRNIDKYLFQYSKHVILTSTKILKDINLTSNETNELSFFFENNCQILHNSFFGKIAIPLLTNLLTIIETSHKDNQKQKIFKYLMRNKLFNKLLNPYISNLLQITDQILTKSLTFTKNKLKKQYKIVDEIRESPHPYPVNTNIKQLVTIPNAKKLIITFDKTVCSTHSEKDFVQLFTKTCNGYVALTQPIYGPSNINANNNANNKWPDQLIINGDSVLIHFTSTRDKQKQDFDEDIMINNTEYGYKINVSAEIEKDNMEKLRWLEDLSCLLVKFHTTIASSFIDPGHLGVSFDSFIPFSLLFIGGYYPYKVPLDIDSNNKSIDQTHLYLPQIQSWVKLEKELNQKYTKDQDELLWKIHDFRELKEDENEEYKTQNDEDTLVFNLAMKQLFICTPRSSILMYEITKKSKHIIEEIQCNIFAVLLRHTGIINEFINYIESLKQKREHLDIPENRYNLRSQFRTRIPREVSILWDRSRIATNNIVTNIENEDLLIKKKELLQHRIDLLMKLSPAHLHIDKITGKFDTKKLLSYSEGYLSPIQKQLPWICNICFHFNDANQYSYCQICEFDKMKNCTDNAGINKRFTWQKTNFPTEDLYESFQSVCQVENIIRSQRSINHNQNQIKIDPIKKLIKQIIVFIAENNTKIQLFEKLLLLQSTLGLLRVKGLQIIYNGIINLTYHDNISQFAQHLSNLLTLSNITCQTVSENLNLTESKQIEKTNGNLKLSSLHSSGFVHILSNVECCGYLISSKISSLLHKLIQFLFEQSKKCDNHQSGFTTPFLHLMGTLIRSQDIEFISSSNILRYLKDFFSLQSIQNNDKINRNVSFQQRVAAWTAFRILIYSTSYPMFSSLPTISVDNIYKENLKNSIISNTSPSSKCIALYADNTKYSRLKMFDDVMQIITHELKLLFKIFETQEKINNINKDDLRLLLETLYLRPITMNNDKNNNNNIIRNNNNKNKNYRWSCNVCTYMNSINDDNCTMCYRGVRPLLTYNDNECNNLNIKWQCLNCGMENNANIVKCIQCGEINKIKSPRNAVNNDKLHILKWVQRLRQQSICNADIQYLYLLQKEINWTNNDNNNDIIHPLSASFGINQLLWLLLRCCPCQDFLKSLQQNQTIINLLLDIVMNENEVLNLSPISKILSIKILIWILPTMEPQFVLKNHQESVETFLEKIFDLIGESDYYSWYTLNKEPLKMEQDRINNNIRLQLVYLVRALFQHNNWISIVEDICFRILSIPFTKSEDITMESPTPTFHNAGSIISRNQSANSSQKSSLCGSDDNECDDDEKYELENIGELVQTPCTKRRLFFGSKDDKDQKDEKDYKESMKSRQSKSSLCFMSLFDNNISLKQICNNSRFRFLLHRIIGILCIMGEYISGLYEGVRVRVKHREREFTGSIIKIEYINPIDPSGDFSKLEILCDNGLNLLIDITNKKSFKIFVLDNITFNPLKLSKAKNLLLVLRSYIHETFIAQHSINDKLFNKTILRRVLSVIRQFSRYNEFSIMVQQFGLIKDLVAISLCPLQKFEDHFDSSIAEENIWKRQSNTRYIEKWKKNLKIGSIIDCQDRLGKWFESEIIQFDPTQKKLLIHYCEWSSKWDEWISLDSERITPWRTHTDGSFKNRGYNPLSKYENNQIKIKLRNPSKNINILQKCILGLKKFNKTETSVTTPIIDDSDIDFQTDDDDEDDDNDTHNNNHNNHNHHNHNNHDTDSAFSSDSENDDDVNDSEDDDNDDDDDDDEDETEICQNERKHPLQYKQNGIPCPNHAYLATQCVESESWNDIISNDSLKFDGSIAIDNKRQSVILNGNCIISNEYESNAPPINHMPNDYEFIGSTLFLCINIPKDIISVSPNYLNHKNNDNKFQSLFEWIFINENDNNDYLKFNIGFSNKRILSIKDNITNNIQHTPINLHSPSNKKPILLMISITNRKYSIYTSFDYQFTKTLSITKPQFPKEYKMRFNITKNKNDKLDGIGIQKIAIWRWISLDYSAFDYLKKWKDIFIESLQHLIPNKKNTVFDKTYLTQQHLNSFKVIDIAQNNNLNQYSIMLSFELTSQTSKTPICLLQIPDDLVMSIIDDDDNDSDDNNDNDDDNNNNNNDYNDEQYLISQTPKRLAISSSNSPHPEIEIGSLSVVRNPFKRKNKDKFKVCRSTKNKHNKHNKPSPDIPMIWIDKRGFIWICDQKTDKKVNINEEHIISLCVNLKKKQLSLIFHTDEIIKINLRTSCDDYKWQKNFKQNGCWTLKSKLIIGGSIHPSNKYKPNNFIIKRITIKPKCINIHEAISFALTSYFRDDPLSDLLGNLGFNVEQIKHSTKWTLNYDKSEWLDLLTKMTTNYKKSNEKSNNNKYNVKIQFKKKGLISSQNTTKLMPPPKRSLLLSRNNRKLNNKHNRNNLIHICSQTQLDKISPEEIRWKLYSKTIMIHSSMEQKYDDIKHKDNNQKIKSDLLLCSHWLYCQIPSEIETKRNLAKKLSNFTCWNREKTNHVLSKIKFDKNDNQSWYHLIEIMYGYQMQQTAIKFGIDNDDEKDNNDNNDNNDVRSYDQLYIHMHCNWRDFQKEQEKLKEDLSGSQNYECSANIVYDTTDRIYQDLINDRWKFYSKKHLYKFREIGNFQTISKPKFNKLSGIIESNLCSLYARDSVLSFLDEFSCFSESLKGLLPSIKFHEAFDNISDNENLVKFLELTFEKEKFARIMSLENAIQSDIKHELNSFNIDNFLNRCMNIKKSENIDNHENENNVYKDDYIINQNEYQCPIIIALMNTVLSRLLKYFDSIQKNMNPDFDHDNDQKEEQKNKPQRDEKLFYLKNGQNINIEFVLWIVSIFVKILTNLDKNNRNQLYKMLILIFNDTLMSLLFDCIVIAPANIGVKVAIMVSQIIEMYPKQHPLQKLKNNLFETIKICDDISSDKNKQETKKHIKINNSKLPELSIKIKHITIIANVLGDMHANSDVTNDILNALIQLMISITSCNYHHSFDLDLNSMAWYQSCCTLYNALKWFSINDNKKRTASSLQFLAPGFYSKLYEIIENWNEISKSDENYDRSARSRSFIYVLQNNVNECFQILNIFKKLLSQPMNQLCKEDTLEKFKKNLIQFSDIAISLSVDKLPEIKKVIDTTQKLTELDEYKNIKKKPDWLILQQIKQLCLKLSSAFNVLYYTIFADETNIIDKYIQLLPNKFDIIMTELVEKTVQKFQIKNINDDNNNFSFENSHLSKDDILWCQDLKNIDNLSSNVRQQSIYCLNQLIIKNSQYIDISNKVEIGFGKLLCNLRHLIISNVSITHCLNSSLEQSQDGQANEPSFQVDRFRCKSEDEPDYLMFTECMKQLHSFKPDTFRLEMYNKAWKCQFANEHATDAGGPYRESIEWMSKEIETNKHLGLFMLCPNGINNTGLNRDKYIPSPNKCSYQDEKMYIFLGKLMGLAMRTKEILPLNIAPIIWKRICNDNITINDILTIDQNAFSIFKYLDPFLKILDKYSSSLENTFGIDIINGVDINDNNNNTNDDINDELNEVIAQIEIFNSLMVRTKSKFQGKSSDGDTYPLIPNGELIPITHKNVRHYKSAFLNFRLTEYDFACNAIRRGLSTVIPINLLNILSWNCVEELICGKPIIDISLFKQMTSYSNCSLNDKTIQIFWNVVKHKMNNNERSKLLQFVWGRSRLPLKKDDFDKKMSIILTDHSNPNDFLPISHTCFFQLDLPKYTDPDIMYQKLVYAITNCGSIDTDE